jgi:hypothetical protein
VASGDLTQQISVAARGEVADLKDTINQMIANLRETTKENAEQGWLDSNLARIGGQLQGQRDLGEVCQMILKEVLPLVNAQVATFFLAVEPGVDELEAEPAEWRLCGSYALGDDIAFGPVRAWSDKPRSISRSCSSTRSPRATCRFAPAWVWSSHARLSCCPCCSRENRSG